LQRFQVDWYHILSAQDLVQLILFYNGGAPEAETCFKTIWDLRELFPPNGIGKSVDDLAYHASPDQPPWPTKNKP
jgi:hypothetical protein